MGSSKKQTVGYRYRMGLHMGLCHEPDAMLEITAGDRMAWRGEVSESSTIYINAPNLFGGDEREGGIQGVCDVMMGRADQAVNPYLAMHQGTPQPAYRGFLGLVFRGLIASNNPYIKNWAVRVRNVLRGWHGGDAWYPAVATVPVGDINRVLPPVVVAEQIDLDANDADQVGAHGVTVEGFNSTDLCLVYFPSGMTYSGWSRWPVDSHSPLPWWHRFEVTKSGGETTSYLTANYLTRAAAFAAAQAAAPIVMTGATSYKFWLRDDILQNRGGVSLRVLRQRGGIGAMNPAHMVYQALTDPDWGMGYPADTIDNASFTAAADALFAEGLGLCMKWNSQTTIQEFTQVVADHASLVYGQDRRTGKFRMRLLRADYDEADLPVFTRHDVKVVRYQRPSLADTVNEVVIEYVDALTGKDATTAPLQNLANIQGQGRVVSQTLSFPGIPTHDLAVRVGMRELQARSSPLWRFSIEAKRRFASLLPGEPFVLDLLDTDVGVRLVMRAGEIDYGETADAVVRAECVEDVFGMPLTAYVGDPGSGGEVPDTSPQVGPAAVFEVPYTELVQTMGAADLEALPDDAGYVGAVALRPAGAPLNYALFTRMGAADFEDAASGDYAPGGVLDEAIPAEPGPTVLKLASATRLVDLTIGSGAFLGEGEDAETVRVDAVDVGALEVTVGRGCGDTVPHEWPAGTTLWGFDVEATADPQQYIDGETIDAKVVNRTSSGQVELDDATTHQVTIASRQARPYPPGWVLVNGQATPPPSIIGDIELAWTHRDRVMQADTLVDSGEPSVGPEPGTTYTVRWILNGVLVHTDSGLTAPEATWSPTGGGIVRVEVESVRDGMTSWQMQVQEFAVGSPLLTELGTMIATETDQPITME